MAPEQNGHLHEHDGDDHDHRHIHDHNHGHAHAPADFGRAFIIGIVLNLAFVVAEVGAGLASKSVALLADGGHNLSDVLSLVVAWGAAVAARRPPTARFTYGLGGFSILAALFNAVFLLVVIGGLSWEAIGRLADPQPVTGATMAIVAAVGIAINGFCAWLFAAGRKDDLNLRGAFMHMAADALVSLGVVVAGLVILLSGWLWLDPVVSLVINAIIIWGTWSLLRDGMFMSLNAVPPGIDAEKVQNYLANLPGVASVHDLHIWGMSTTDTALTAHLVMPDGHPGDQFLSAMADALRARFKIGHATVQIESSEEPGCALAPADVV